MLDTISGAYSRLCSEDEMTGIEFVKLLFEDLRMPDDIADAILWGCTGFPSFFRTDNPVKEMAYSLRHAKRSLKRGFTIDQIYAGEDKCITTAFSGREELRH